MLDTYLDYFKANYTGNRAPLHIGHHFTDYQRGAYREALKSFARTVCGLPEVRCVSYKMLADFLDKASPETLAAYRKGDFPRAHEPAIDRASSSDGAGRDASRRTATQYVTRPAPLPSRAWRACA